MPERTFKDETAIVTGAGQGIGFEICRLLALGGASVILNDMDIELGRKAAAAIRKTGGTCMDYGGDCSDPEFIGNLVRFAVDQTGRLDIAIGNAGITLQGEFLSFTPESFNRLVQVNIAGNFFLAQAAAAQMKLQQSGGTILFTSSVTGHLAHRNLVPYGMTKAAIEMLAKTLVIELSQFKINVNTVAPGATLTERTMADPEYEKKWSAVIPTGRAASTADIANAALFLVSRESKHITGQSLLVDGGITCICSSPY
jgi:NAD(P)-dependent dehydrogenase (short-subunit alcohol dehydrogenase family)